MPTYRDLLDKLSTLSSEQLDQDIKIVPLGYTDDLAHSILRYRFIPGVLELTKASRSIYHYSANEESFMESGVADFSDDEIKDLEIDKDRDYHLICKKGEVFFKIKDNVFFQEEQR